MDTKKGYRLLPIILAMIVLVLACSIPGQNQIPAATMPPAPPIVITVVVEATRPTCRNSTTNRDTKSPHCRTADRTNRHHQPLKHTCFHHQKWRNHL